MSTQAAEGLAMVSFAAGGAGPTVMRFTQILKVYTRLKYIGVNFGDGLDDYLTAIGEIFNDCETDINKINDILKKEGGYGGKVSRYRVYAEPFSTLSWKIFAYFTTFFLNLIAIMVAKWIQKTNQINKGIQKHLKIITLIRHVHFMFFNMVLVDGAFYSSRVIAHIKITEQSGILIIIICYLLLLFMTLDLWEIFKTGLNLKKKSNPFHRDQITKMEKEFKAKI